MLTVVFEGFDGVFAGGFEGRVDAEENADDEGSGNGETENLPGDERFKWGDEGNEES